MAKRRDDFPARTITGDTTIVLLIVVDNGESLAVVRFALCNVQSVKDGSKLLTMILGKNFQLSDMLE